MSGTPGKAEVARDDAPPQSAESPARSAPRHRSPAERGLQDAHVCRHFRAHRRRCRRPRVRPRARRAGAARGAGGRGARSADDGAPRRVDAGEDGPGDGAVPAFNVRRQYISSPRSARTDSPWLWTSRGVPSPRVSLSDRGGGKRGGDGRGLAQTNYISGELQSEVEARPRHLLAEYWARFS